MSTKSAAQVINLAASRDSNADGKTAGEKLAKARLAAGLSQARVSDATKVKLEHIDAIENFDPARLPAAPYAVGFVKSYARFLGLDSEAIARQFRQELKASSPAEEVAELSPNSQIASAEDGVKIVSLFGVLAIISFAIWIAFQIAGNGRVEENSGGEAPAKIRVASEPVATPKPKLILSRTDEVIAVNESSVEQLAPSEENAAAQAPVENIGAEQGGLTTTNTEAPSTVNLANDEPAEPVAPETAIAEAESTIDDMATPPVAESPVSADLLNGVEANELAPLEAPAALSIDGAPIIEPAGDEPVLEENLATVEVQEIVAAQIERSHAPVYPNRCIRAAGQQETVTVMFDVTPEGRTVNARAVAATNSCFSDAAVSAVKRWRYTPKTVNGAPQATIGERATLQFQQ